MWDEFYVRKTIEVWYVRSVCNKKLASPKYSQDQKKIVCDILDELFECRYEGGSSWDYKYWLEHGKKQWEAAGCPESNIKKYQIRKKVNAVSLYLDSDFQKQYEANGCPDINPATNTKYNILGQYDRLVWVDPKYIGEEYTRVYSSKGEHYTPVNTKIDKLDF